MPKRGEMVVDFCAGAGGKTLALGAAMRNTGRLYAFDVSGHRLDALKPRLARSGLSNVYPVQIAHERDERIKRLAGKIDRVLVDAPCSGLGTCAAIPDLKWRQSPQAVARTARQAGGDPGQRGAAAQAGRAPGLRDLQPAASRERGDRRGFRRGARRDFEPLPVAELLEQAHVATRPTRWSTGELPALVAASARHRRLLRRRLGNAVEQLTDACDRTAELTAIATHFSTAGRPTSPYNRAFARLRAQGKNS